MPKKGRGKKNWENWASNTTSLTFTKVKYMATVVRYTRSNWCHKRIRVWLLYRLFTFTWLDGLWYVMGRRIAELTLLLLLAWKPGLYLRLGSCVTINVTSSVCTSVPHGRLYPARQRAKICTKPRVWSGVLLICKDNGGRPTVGHKGRFTVAYISHRSLRRESHRVVPSPKGPYTRLDKT